MKRKILLFSIALITAGFLTSTAQNNFTGQDILKRQNINFEYPEFEKPKLPTPKKIKTGQDWWEPDTIYIFYTNTSKLERRILKYNTQGLLKEYVEQSMVNNSWENDIFVTYTYDSNKNKLSDFIQTWQNNSWENGTLVTYTYDSNNNMLTYLPKNWRNNSWVNGTLVTYTYDSNNNMLTYLRHSWQNNSWVNFELTNRTYDSQNNMLTELYESGDYKRLETYTYDCNSNTLSFLRQYWMNNSWMNISSLTYVYDCNNNMLTCLQKGWRNNSWENSYLTTYTYDSNNNLLSELLEQWTNNSLENSLLITYTYDSNNNMLTTFYQEWRGDSWRNYLLFTYTYDSNNNLLTGLEQRWINSICVNSSKYLITYDENMNGTSAEHWAWSEESWQPFDYSGSFMYLYVHLYYNNMQSGFSGSGCKMTASYIKVSDNTTAIEPIAPPELNDISVYPNPTTGELRMENGELTIKDVHIFDIFGRKIINYQLSIVNSMDISYLPAGIYFVRITTEKGVVTKKVVKK